MKGPFSLLDHPPCHDVGERGPERHLLSPFEPSSGEYDVGLRVSSRWDLTQNTLGGTAISYTYISQGRRNCSCRRRRARRLLQCFRRRFLDFYLQRSVCIPQILVDLALLEESRHGDRRMNQEYVDVPTIGRASCEYESCVFQDLHPIAPRSRATFGGVPRVVCVVRRWCMAPDLGAS